MLSRRRLKNYLFGLAFALAMTATMAFPRVSSRGWTTVEVIADVICIVCFTAFASGFIESHRRRCAKRYMNLYDDECDPGAFAVAAEKSARRLKRPYDDFAAWFLTPYAQALVDVGRIDDARIIADNLLIDAEKQHSPSDRASMLINMEPIISLLHGWEKAYQLLSYAQELLDQAPVADDSGRRSYVAWRRGLLGTLIEKNDNKLLELLSDIRKSKTCSWRLRVMCAIDEASVHFRRNDESRERECLEFVVEHGNKLPCVPVATSRLGGLEASVLEESA